MTGPGDSALYFGTVMHARVTPFRHKFAYRVFSCLFDLDELPELSARTWFFSHNKFNLFSFYDVDHGTKDGAPFRPWAEALLGKAGINAPIGQIKLLCYPRILGYVFNPLSVYYAYDVSGNLIALIYEVSNTFGEEHSYVGRIEESDDASLHVQTTKKVFYVSPFIEVTGNYTFKFDDPAEHLRLGVQQNENDAPTLYTSFSGAKKSFTALNLLKAFVKYPLMTLKVITAIHWEALKLWMKGAKYIPRPKRPNVSFTAAHGVSSKRPPLKKAS